MKKTEDITDITEKIHRFIFDKKERTFEPQTAFQQMMVRKSIVWCWGAEGFQGVGEAGLYFQVNGYKHKGFVVITLGFMDTYDIHLLDWDGQQVGETLRDIYCDQLTWAIDGLVETT